MDWVAIKGIMAAQIVLAADCTQDEALQIVDRNFAKNSGRINMKPEDVCSMILLGVSEARHSGEWLQ